MTTASAAWRLIPAHIVDEVPVVPLSELEAADAEVQRLRTAQQEALSEAQELRTILRAYRERTRCEGLVLDHDDLQRVADYDVGAELRLLAAVREALGTRGLVGPFELVLRADDLEPEAAR